MVLPANPARSRLMASVRQRDTDPETALRRALFACGLRYRLTTKPRLPGTPDIVFRGSRVAVFVDGCFWHGCPAHGSWPKSNADFWRAKIERNRERDHDVDEALTREGWLPVRVWEHEIKQDVEGCALQLWGIVRSRELESR